MQIKLAVEREQRLFEALAPFDIDAKRLASLPSAAARVPIEAFLSDSGADDRAHDELWTAIRAIARAYVTSAPASATWPVLLAAEWRANSVALTVASVAALLDAMPASVVADIDAVAEVNSDEAVPTLATKRDATARVVALLRRDARKAFQLDAQRGVVFASFMAHAGSLAEELREIDVNVALAAAVRRRASACAFETVFFASRRACLLRCRSRCEMLSMRLSTAATDRAPSNVRASSASKWRS